MKANLRIFSPLLFVLLAGCAVSTSDTVVTSPAVGTGGMTEGSRVDTNLPTTVAILPFTNSTDSDFAYEVVRRTMANHFSTRNYRWLHWRDVDNRLALAGIEPGKIDAMGRDELAKLLGVDGLIYGNITHYNKTFAGIYAQIAVGVELSFVTADDRVIWAVKDVRRSHAGGVSTSPVGLLMNALVSAKHLLGDLNLYRAADDLGRDLAKEIPEPASLAQREKPVITNVVHSGVGQHLNYGDTLTIGMEAAPGLTAAAVIEGLGVVDLSEATPGEYVGSINVGSAVDLDNVVVSGRVLDQFGQTATWISPYGLLNIDNTPPDPVVGASAESRDGAVHVVWQASAGDVASFAVGIASSETATPDQFTPVANAEYTVRDISNFEPVYLAIVATDLAGNTSTPTRLTGMAAPDVRFGAAADTGSTIPAVITGVMKMTRAGSPYYLRSESRVATDGVLLVAPDVQFIVSPGGKLAVLGELHVFGSATNPVSAAGADGQSFAEFMHLQSTRPVTIRGLRVDGAGIPLQISAGSPLIVDSQLLNSQFNAISINGAARPVIRDSVIAGARTSGVIIEGQSQPSFVNNRFSNNEPFHLQNGSTYQVNATNNTFEPAASGMTILGDVRY